MRSMSVSNAEHKLVKIEVKLKAEEGVNIPSISCNKLWNVICNLLASRPRSKLCYLCSVEDTSISRDLVCSLKTTNIHTSSPSTPPICRQMIPVKRTSGRSNQPWSPKKSIHFVKDICFSKTRRQHTDVLRHSMWLYARATRLAKRREYIWKTYQKETTYPSFNGQ